MQTQNTTRGNLSWADIEGCGNTNYYPMHYENGNMIVTQNYQGGVAQGQGAKKNHFTPKEPREPKKSSRQCYTCKPRGKVLKHIIRGSDNGNVIFHYDLHKRPLILVTTKKHYETFYEIPHNEVLELFRSIKTFCDFWGIKDYSISYNNGTWQTHPHFHIKIKTNEKIVNRLRRDHFALLTLNTNYSQQP